MAGRFPKYDLSPLGAEEYRENTEFLVDASKSDKVEFSEYLENLHPRVLDGVMREVILPDDSALDVWDLENLEVRESDLTVIADNIIDSIPDGGFSIGSLTGSKSSFEEFYERTNWNPDLDIMNSDNLEHYKLKSPYMDKVREFEQKSVLNQGRELPFLAGGAGGIPVAASQDSTVLMGAGAALLAGYGVSRLKSENYEAKAKGIEKKVEDEIYEEIAWNYDEDFGDKTLEIV